MCKLSFIIPVYNVAPYLRKCVDSLLAQDYDDYEIILIDDGSTDGSGAICDEYVRAFEIGDCKLEIKCIHQENRGLSAARNAGLKVAKGEYVCFVDSDDYWEPNVLGSLMAQVERDNLDVLRFDYQNVRLVESHYEVFEPYKRDHRLDNDYSEKPTDGVSFLNSRFGTACYAVMFIVRRAMLFSDWTLDIGHCTFNNTDCFFTEGIYFEDTDWTPRMLMRAKRVASTYMVVYNYLQRKGSITNAQDNSKQKKVLEDKMRLVGELKQQTAILQKEGKSTTWFNRMIADTVISIINTLSLQFYTEKLMYIEQLKQMNVFPLCTRSIKSRLINISPLLMVKLLHYKNG